MLIFFDESFRKSKTVVDKPVGMLLGIAIKEEELSQIVSDVFHLKVNHFGAEIAKKMEIKGAELLKNWVFELEKKGTPSTNLAFASDLLDYIIFKKLIVLGCVCFEAELHDFKCEDVRSLDKTFFYVFERVDIFMKHEHPDRLAKLIFDDRDFHINKTNSEAITNFFVRSPAGLALTSVVKIPFFAISQAQNIGLQLADFVNYIVGSRFIGDPKIDPYWKKLKNSFYTWDAGSGIKGSSLKVLRDKK
jgi:Protein of unknown function (DUF3800)